MVVLIVLLAAFPPVISGHPVDILLQAESMTASTGIALSDASASGGAVWKLTDVGTLQGTWFSEHAGAYSVNVVARGDPANTVYPYITVFTDQRAIAHWQVNGSYARYSATDYVPQTNHSVTILFSNPLVTAAETRALYVDYVEITLTVPGAAQGIWREVENFTSLPVGGLTNDTTASNGHAWNLWSNGTVTTSFTVPTTRSTYNVTVWARTDTLLGVGATMVLRADNQFLRSWQLGNNHLWAAFYARATLAPGSHTLSISFTNDDMSLTEDRNLHLDAVRLVPTAPDLPSGAATRYEVENFSYHTGKGRVALDPSASAGARWSQFSNGLSVLNYTPPVPGDIGVSIRARGSSANGVWPDMSLVVDGVTVQTWNIASASPNASTWTLRSTTLRLNASQHALAIAFTNDVRTTTEDRNLYLDYMDLVPSYALDPLPPPSPGPSQWGLPGQDLNDTRFNANEGRIGPGNVSNLTLAWNFVTPRSVIGTPAVVNGTVYFGDWSGVVYAVDAVNGTQRWNYSLHNGAISDSPLVADDRVFVGTGGGKLAAFNASSGAFLWALLLDSFNRTHAWASPIAFAGKVYMGVASDQESRTYNVTPDFRGSMLRIDAATGAIEWRTYTVPPGFTGGSMWSTPALDTTTMTLYIGTGNAYTTPAANTTDAIMAFDANTGAIKWSYQATQNDAWTALSPLGPDNDFASPVHLWRSSTGASLVGTGNKAGDFFALNATTGALVFTIHLPVTGEAFFGGEAFAYGRNFATTVNDGLVVAMNADTGAIIWQQRLPATIFAAATVANGVVYTGSTDGVLWAFDAGTGAILWREALPVLGANSFVAPSIAEGTLFAPYSANGYVFGTGGVAAYRLAT